MESDSLDLSDKIAALEREIAALKAQQAEDSRINTGGGAVVGNSVQTRGGHFIGRDFIQTVNNITRTGEDPEEAQSVIALYLYALALDLAGLKLGEIDSSPDPTKQSPLLENKGHPLADRPGCFPCPCEAAGTGRIPVRESARCNEAA